MEIIKSVVQCTPEQYIELLKNGEVEVNGELKKYNNTTLYDTGNLELIEWYNKIMEAQYKQVEAAHTPIVMLSLEEQYKAIVGEEFNEETDGDTLAYISAIGYTAILKDGDTIKVAEPNKGIFYINGSVATNDYTYNGDGYEVVNVWVFENKYELKLNDAPTFIITELNVRNLMSTPEISDGYILYTTTLKTYNFDIKSLTAKKLVSNGAETFIQSVAYMPTYIEEIQSDCVTFPGTSYLSPLNNKTSLKKAVFPNLTTINGGFSAGGTTFLSGCSNAELEISFPNLKTINNHTGNASREGAFGSVKNVILPPSVTYVGTKNFYNNQTIILNCNRATFNLNWCNSTPTVNFVMCDNWQGTIDIAVAAKNHTIDWFIDLFENKLAEVAPGSKGISIPVAIYDTFCEMEESALDVAEAKGWIVGGV